MMQKSKCNSVATQVAASEKMQPKLQKIMPATAKKLFILPPSLGCNSNHRLTTPSLRNCNGVVFEGMGWSGEHYGGSFMSMAVAGN